VTILRVGGYADPGLGFAETAYVNRWVVTTDGRVMRAQTRLLTDGTYAVRIKRGRSVYLDQTSHAFDRKEDAEAFAAQRRGQ